MDAMTQTQKDKAERKVCNALDAVQDLCDMGLGDFRTDRIFGLLREIEGKVQDAPVKASHIFRRK